MYDLKHAINAKRIRLNATPCTPRQKYHINEVVINIKAILKNIIIIYYISYIIRHH